MPTTHSLEDVVLNHNFKLVSWHENARDMYTLTFENFVTGEHKSFSNVAFHHIPSNVHLELSKYKAPELPHDAEFEQIKNMALSFDDIVNDSDWKLVSHHKNVRGLYTMVFEHTIHKNRKAFASIAPEHIPQSLLRQVEMDTGVGRHSYELGQIVADPAWQLVQHHINSRGKYTLIFEHAISGERYAFASVNAEHVPLELLSQLDELQHEHAKPEQHHLLEIANNPMYDVDHFERNANNNVSIAFVNRETGKRYSFNNVKYAHIPLDVIHRIAQA